MKSIFHDSNNSGLTKIDWLYSRHSFSFGEYFDPAKIHFGMLRVLNDDIVKPGQGFGTHPHHDMEIITIPLSGTLQHNDSTGTFSLINPGDVQVMTAGTGIYHSEFNHSLSEDVHFLQIWIFPDKKSLTPGYDQRSFAPELFSNKFHTVVRPDAQDDILKINQNAYLSLGYFTKRSEIEYKLYDSRHGIYIFVIEGKASTSGIELQKRDAAGLSEIDQVILTIEENSHILIIEVPLN
jgi:redox-sensitive bicupin YhaK (pirin superfamily)